MDLNAGLVIPRGSDAARSTLGRAFVDRVIQAEQLGVEMVWTTVGGPTADPVTAYAAAAALTERIRLGTAVVPTYPRHPFVLAAQAMAINDLAPGRLRLGVGTSHRPMIEGAYGIPMGKPLEHLREYVAILRALLWEGSVEDAGAYFSVTMSLPDGVAAPQIPLLMSALRPNAFRLAGEIADGAISWVTPIDYLVEAALPELRAGSEAMGRARPPVIAHVPVSVSTDRAAARAAFREQFPIYAKLPFYVAMFEMAGFPVTASGEMTDPLVDVLSVSGSPAEIRDQLTSIRARGIDELMISHVVVADAEAELAALAEVIATT